MKCPKCRGELRQTQKALGCSNYYMTGCDFAIWNTIAGHVLTDKEKEDLVLRGETELIDDLIGRKGGRLSAYISLDEQKKTMFTFPMQVDKKFCHLSKLLSRNDHARIRGVVSLLQDKAGTIHHVLT